MADDHGSIAAGSLSDNATSLDPPDWSALRALGHRMIDDMFDHLAGLAAEPVWRPMPAAVRQTLRGALTPADSTPADSTPADSAPVDSAPVDSAAAAYDGFRHLIAPYATGNLHPRFMGWVEPLPRPRIIAGACREAVLFHHERTRCSL